MINDNQNIDFLSEKLFEFLTGNKFLGPTFVAILLLAIGFLSYAINH